MKNGNRLTTFRSVLVGLSLTTGLLALPSADSRSGTGRLTVLRDTGRTAGSVREVPVVNVPRVCRAANWTSAGEGSCVHASLVTLLRWQGLSEHADWWASCHAGGETPVTLAPQLLAAGLDFAETRDGNVGFLEWAVRTRRGACVTVQGGRHMVCLVHLDERRAGLIDNNSPEQVVWLTRQQFLDEWQSSRWRWAITPVYNPPPQPPWQSGDSMP